MEIEEGVGTEAEGTTGKSEGRERRTKGGECRGERAGQREEYGEQDMMLGKVCRVRSRTGGSQSRGGESRG